MKPAGFDICCALNAVSSVKLLGGHFSALSADESGAVNCRYLTGTFVCSACPRNLVGIPIKFI